MKNLNKIIWNSNLAYAVGLLATDGNLSSDGRHIVMRSSDLDQLDTFKKCLGLTNSIGVTKNNSFSKKPCYRVQFGDIKLYKWLCRIGVKPAKTYTIGRILIPKKFFRDFLRGHLDGDGCIQTYEDTYNSYKGKNYTNTRIYTRFISASEDHIKWLFQNIRKYLPVKGGALLYRHDRKRNRAPMWEARFSKYDSLKLLQWMYYSNDLPALGRKRKLADTILNNANN